MFSEDKSSRRDYQTSAVRFSFISTNRRHRPVTVAGVIE